jgi:hypothetical protein
MRLSEAVELLARRLSLRRGRVAAIANRLQHAGMLPLAEAKKTPPELSDYEFAALLLAVLAESGVGSAAERAQEYAAMRSSEGYRLSDAILAIIRGQAQPGDIIIREGGASGAINGVHLVFGAPADDGPARFCTGPTLASVVAELRGMSPSQADAAAAITRIKGF